MRSLWLVGLCLLVAVGCGGPNASSEKGSGSGESSANAKILRYPLPDNPTTLDPGVVQDGDTIDALQQVYEGLVTWGEDNTVQPLLAESWKVEDDGKTYIFSLKKGVKFHNGREVTAEDFKWTWERNANPALKSTTAGAYMTDIVGVRDVVEGKATEISGVKVVDPHTLRVEIDKPRPYFLGKLTFMVTAVLPKEVVEATEIDDVKKMIGTGPFMADRFVPQALLSMKRNPDYHGGPAKLDGIERIVVKDVATRLNKYRGGEFDLLQVERQDVAGIQKDDSLKNDLKFWDRPSIFYVGMNQDAYAPFKDRDVRRAFAMAIDRKTIVETYLGGINKLANTIVPPGVPGHREQGGAVLPFDPDAAKKLLADAGYPGGKGLPALEIRYRQARRDISLVAEAVAAQIKENLGVEVKTREMEWRAYLDLYNKGENPFFHMRWAADYLDPENFLSFMLSTEGPENHIGYSNPEFDRLCAEADSMMDLEKRLPRYHQAEDIVLQDAPWVPIYFQRDAELIRSRVSGLRTSLFGHLPHTTTDLTRAP